MPTLSDDFRSRMAGCLKQQKINAFFAIALYFIAFLASAAATISAALGTVPHQLVAVIAAVPTIVALALSTFRPDARSLWWWVKFGKLDDLLNAVQYEHMTEEVASKELREFLRVHEAKYPGLGPVPS